MQEETHNERTDWNAYYQKAPGFARITRSYTRSRLLALIQKFLGENQRDIIEIGGANSCFVEDICKNNHPKNYSVIDNNAFGIELLKKRCRDLPQLSCEIRDLFELEKNPRADLCFSVGLIEHFDREGTKKAIQTHFDLVKPGGLVLLTFPTPTWLYRAIRKAAEKTNSWKFPDERPLAFAEVLSVCEQNGRSLWTETLWPLGLTQGLVIFRKF